MSLGTLEAMSVGLPCIHPAWSAFLDYSDDTVAYPITDFGFVPFWGKRGTSHLAPSERRSTRTPCSK